MSSRRPRGTRASLRSGSVLVTSSGIPALDERLQGGVPVGAVLLVKNASSAMGVDYAPLLHRYFLAEAQATGHGVFCASKRTNGVLVSIPKLKSVATQDESVGMNDKQDPMRIAWRYNDQKPKSYVDSQSGISHGFDLSESVDMEKLSLLEGGCHHFCPSGEDSFKGLREALENVLKQDQYALSATQTQKNVLRISLNDLGGATYGSNSNSELPKFLLLLRSLLRSHVGVAFVSLAPSVLNGDDGLMARIGECADFVISLRSFNRGSRESKLFQDWHGMLEIEKSSGFNMLSRLTNEDKFVFRSSRKQFSLKPPHLPPELQEEEEKPSTKPDRKASRKANIDF